MSTDQMLAIPKPYLLNVECPPTRNFEQTLLSLEQLLGTKHSFSGTHNLSAVFGFYFATRYERGVASELVEDSDSELIATVRKDLDPPTDMPRVIEQLLHVVKQLQHWLDQVGGECNASFASFEWGQSGTSIKVGDYCVWDSEGSCSDCMTFEVCRDEFLNMARSLAKFIPVDPA